MTCKKCGAELFLSKQYSNTAICPNCETIYKISYGKDGEPGDAKEQKGSCLITGLSIMSVIVLILICAVVVIGLLWPRIKGSVGQDSATAQAVYGEELLIGEEEPLWAEGDAFGARI